MHPLPAFKSVSSAACLECLVSRVHYFATERLDVNTVSSISSFPLPTLLATIAILLLLVTSVGIIYLTAADWRDKRRQSEDKKLKP